MAKKRNRDWRDETLTDTNTGTGHGVSAMGGIAAGGGGLAGENEGETTDVLGGRDTSTGMAIGLGQSTSTGTLPTTGGPDLSGTSVTSAVVSGQGYEPPYAHNTDEITDPRSERDKMERNDWQDPSVAEGNPELNQPSKRQMHKSK